MSGWLDSGGGDGWDMLTPDQQQTILDAETHENPAQPSEED